MTTKYALAQVSDSAKIISSGEKYLWRSVPGIGGFQAHRDGTVKASFGSTLLTYDSRFGYYTPLAGTLAPVHLLVAASWLPYPNHLSAFEMSAYMHRLVIHKDGANYNNAVDNLAWADSPGEDAPGFYEWLMRQADWAIAPQGVSPAMSPKWRGE